MILKSNGSKKIMYFFLTTVCLFTFSMNALFANGNAESNSATNNVEVLSYDFNKNTDPWSLYLESGGSSFLANKDGKLAITILNNGTVMHAVQLYLDEVPLYTKGIYKVSFDISSTINRPIEFRIQQNGGTYQAYTLEKIDVTKKSKRIEYEFTMEGATDTLTRLAINCGKFDKKLDKHVIYIDNISLELLDASHIDKSTIAGYEPQILTNQVGFKPENKKIAVFRNVTNENKFSVVNAETEKKVFTGNLYGKTENKSAEEINYFGDFSSVKEAGTYYISCGNLDNSYTFKIGNDIHDNLFNDAIRFLYIQRCGCAVYDEYFSHPPCHTGLAQIYGTDKKIDVSGGWHDAGDFGRYVVPGAKTIADLLYAYQKNPELFTDFVNIPETGNGIPDILDEVRYELEWMLKMQADNGGVYHKVTAANFPGFVMPQKETEQLIVTPISTTATADFCAAMALAYEFYQDIDNKFASECLSAATEAWKFLEKNPNILFQNPSDIFTGAYDDTNDSDERYWAAAQMYRATSDNKYLEAAKKIGLKSGLDWQTVGDYGNIALLTMKNADKNSEIYKNAKKSIIEQADKFVATTNSEPYGVGINDFHWGSNMAIANAGIILGLAHDLTNNDSYIESIESNLHYLLGTNPVGQCFITGYGTASAKYPHHRPTIAMSKVTKGMLIGGVCSYMQDDIAKEKFVNTPPAKCYIDHTESFSTNEVTIYWNSPFIYMMSFL